MTNRVRRPGIAPLHTRSLLRLEQRLRTGPHAVGSVRLPGDTASCFVVGLLFALLVVAGTACGGGPAFPSPGPTPDEPELETMTHLVMTGFAEAVQEEDFTEFYEMYAIGSRMTISPSSLKRAYQHFIDNDIDLRAVATVDPVFDGPPTRESSNRVILVQGHFPLPSMNLGFKIRYQFVEGQWHLHKFQAIVPE